MSLENRLHIQSENPDLLIEFDLPPGTHAVIGASPKSEITLPLTGIPPFSFILGRFQDGRVFLADLEYRVLRRVDIPDILSIPPYEFTLYHPVEPEPEVPEVAPDGTPTKKTRQQMTKRKILELFRTRPKKKPVVEETAAPADAAAVEDAAKEEAVAAEAGGEKKE